MTDYVCVGCGSNEGHSEGCGLGGYARAEDLAWVCRAEREHDDDHSSLAARVEGCDWCLLDPPMGGIRVTAAGHRELREASERYGQRRTTLEEYDAERAAIIAAHPA